MKLVFILVDALKASYLTKDNMPFLYGIAQKNRYIKHVIPSAGFCERCEILSGLDGFDTGNFTAIGYKPEESSYSGFNFAIFFLRKLVAIHPYFIKYLNKYVKRRGLLMKPYLIPIKSLPYFALTEDGVPKIKYRTILDSLRDANKTYNLGKFTTLSPLCEHSALSDIDFIYDCIEKKVDFIPLYIGIIDTKGHVYGDNLTGLKPYLQYVDNLLFRISEIADKNDYAFAVLGDHGMVPVRETIDINKYIKECKLKLHKDYEIFIDSTVVRFWFHNDNARLKITKILSSLDKGTIIDKTNYHHYRIPLDILNDDGIPIYGDIAWIVNPGILLVPDYFNSSKVQDKGMHGYLKVDKKHGTGLFVAKSTNITKHTTHESHLKNICEELCDILEIKRPNCESWIRTKL